MKRSLGKTILFLCGIVSSAWGGAFHWNVLESPSSLRVGESGIIRYECTFDTSAADYTIDFKPKGSEQYKAEMLTQRDRVTNGKRIQTFDVLITPKHPGKLDISLQALIRHTTFASIENATIGRDNVKRYDFNDETAFLPAVEISAQENTADLTGEITMEAKADTNMVRAHQPVHLSLFVRGKGNLDHYVPYELNISGVTIFAEPAQKNFAATKEGYEGEIRQEFALVGEKSYDIPSFTIDIFDTKERRIKQLKTQPIHIDVSEGYDPKTLLDPPDLSDTATLKKIVVYVGLVFFGVALGELFRWIWRHRPRRRRKTVWEQAKNQKELVMLIALGGDKRHESILTDLEEGKLSLGEAKKKLSTLTKANEVKE